MEKKTWAHIHGHNKIVQVKNKRLSSYTKMQSIQKFEIIKQRRNWQKATITTTSYPTVASKRGDAEPFGICRSHCNCFCSKRCPSDRSMPRGATSWRRPALDGSQHLHSCSSLPDCSRDACQVRPSNSATTPPLMERIQLSRVDQSVSNCTIQGPGL